MQRPKETMSLISFAVTLASTAGFSLLLELLQSNFLNEQLKTTSSMKFNLPRRVVFEVTFSFITFFNLTCFVYVLQMLTKFEIEEWYVALFTLSPWLAFSEFAALTYPYYSLLKYWKLIFDPFNAFITTWENFMKMNKVLWLFKVVIAAMSSTFKIIYYALPIFIGQILGMVAVSLGLRAIYMTIIPSEDLHFLERFDECVRLLKTNVATGFWVEFFATIGVQFVMMVLQTFFPSTENGVSWKFWVKTLFISTYFTGLTWTVKHLTGTFANPALALVTQRYCFLESAEIGKILLVYYVAPIAGALFFYLLYPNYKPVRQNLMTSTPMFLSCSKYSLVSEDYKQTFVLFPSENLQQSNEEESLSDKDSLKRSPSARVIPAFNRRQKTMRSKQRKLRKC